MLNLFVIFVVFIANCFVGIDCTGTASNKDDLLYFGRIHGCSHNFNASIAIAESGKLIINSYRYYPDNTNSNEITNEITNHYLFVNISGGNSIQSSIITNDPAFYGLLPIIIHRSGIYEVKISLSYNNTNSAYGLKDLQETELACELLNEDGKHITLVVPRKKMHNANSASSVNVKGNHSNITHTTHTTHATHNAHSTHVGSMWMLGHQSMHNTLRYKPPQHTNTKVTKHYISPHSGEVHHKYETNLKNCICDKSIVLLGDSHSDVVYNTLKKLNLDCNMIFKYDGLGVMHNTSPDIDFEGYSTGLVGSQFVKGQMLINLENGYYLDLVHTNHSKTFIIQSGHWDLRDVTLETYITNIDKLFNLWVKFRMLTGIHLIWFGVPAYSFRRSMWGGLEKRTNVKLALADNYIKNQCILYNISYISYFDI